MIIDICAAGDAETERNLIQLDESVEAVEYLAEPLQVAVSAVSVPMSEKVRSQALHTLEAIAAQQAMQVEDLLHSLSDHAAGV